MKLEEKIFYTFVAAATLMILIMVLGGLIPLSIDQWRHTLQGCAK